MRQKSSDWIKRIFISNNHPLDLLAGLLTGMQATIYSVTFASIIFSGVLHPFQSLGISIFLLGTAVVALIIGFGSSSRIITACPQDTAAILGLVISASLVAGTHQHYPASNPFPTVLVSLGIMTLIMGLFSLLLGFFKLGKLVHFIPFPVMGGFLAGTGWLIFKAAFTAINLNLGFESLDTLIDPKNLPYWLPGLLYAFIIISVMRHYRHFLIYPTLILGGFVLFYLVLYCSGTSVNEAKTLGLMLGPFENQSNLNAWRLQFWQEIHWDLILQQSNNFLIAALINVSGLLLRLVGFELATKKNLKLDQELICAGTANMAAGAFGCIPGFHSLSYSILNYRLGASGRLTSLMAGLIALLVLYCGASLLSYIPRFIFCVLLFTMGLFYLAEWVIDARKNLSTTDYIIVISILLMIANVGLFAGIGLGILISLVVFVIKYSFLPAIRNSFRGDLFHSNTIRNARDLQVLKNHGAEILIILLQDYLFFGNSDTIVEHIEKSYKKFKLRFIIIDFRLLRGFDSSAAVSLIKIEQFVKKKHIQVLFTQIMDPQLIKIKSTFNHYGIDNQFILLPTLDHGLQWCEDQLLEQYGAESKSEPISELLHNLLPDIPNTKILMQYMIKDRIKKGECIYQEGAPADELFFIESGEVEIYRLLADKSINRFSTLKAGSIVGEIGLYLKSIRSANASATEDCIIYRMHESAFIRLQKENPALANSFHQGIVKLLAERVVRGNLIIEQLLQ